MEEGRVNCNFWEGGSVLQSERGRVEGGREGGRVLQIMEGVRVLQMKNLNGHISLRRCNGMIRGNREPEQSRITSLNNHATL